MNIMWASKNYVIFRIPGHFYQFSKENLEKPEISRVSPYNLWTIPHF